MYDNNNFGLYVRKSSDHALNCYSQKTKQYCHCFLTGMNE